MLLAGAGDPGTLVVKTVETKTKDASYDQTTFYEAWRTAIQRYGIYNLYTGHGAIKGLLPHGPHNVRDVFATQFLKQTGSYEQASTPSRTHRRWLRTITAASCRRTRRRLLPGF